MTLFATFKFQNEVIKQKKQMEAAEAGQVLNSHGTSDSDSDGVCYDANSYEKLVNILQLVNVMLMKAQTISGAFLDFMY